ncbi:MAG: hypothetical protein Q7U54_00465 [Bacteroidales bacterium]|nr:hypothetical protein [Bacteroidales bacterium]
MKSEEEFEKLRMENELKKIKLMLEHGAMFSDNQAKMPLDPFIENQFLNNIEAFERSFTNAEQILLYDFINRPDYTKVEAIPDSLIHTELDRIMNILDENGIQLDTLCDVEEREIYRFVTEELFMQEVDNMRIPGMMTCFIYEEFHPNHEYDIRNYCFEGVEAFLNKKEKYVTMHFTKEASESNWFRNFRGAFSSFTINHFEITDILITGINASATFTIDFTGIIEGSKQHQNFAGSGSAEFLFQYDYWYIQMLNLPGASPSR